MALIHAGLRPVASAEERTRGSGGGGEARRSDDVLAVPDQFFLQQVALAARQSQTYAEGKQHWNTLDRIATSVTETDPAVAGFLARLVDQNAKQVAPTVGPVSYEDEGRRERLARDIEQEAQEMTPTLESGAATAKDLLKQTLTAVRGSNPPVPAILANLLSGVARAANDGRFRRSLQRGG